jgi:hypothetical protein
MKTLMMERAGRESLLRECEIVTWVRILMLKISVSKRYLSTKDTTTYQPE